MDPITHALAAADLAKGSAGLYETASKEIKSNRYGKIKVQFFGIIDFSESVTVDLLEEKIREQLELKKARKVNTDDFVIEDKIHLTGHVIEPVFVEEIDGELYIANEEDSESVGSTSSRLLVKRATFNAVPEKNDKESIVKSGTLFASYIEGIVEKLQPARTFIITKIQFLSVKKAAQFYDHAAVEMKHQNLSVDQYLMLDHDKIKITLRVFSEVGRILFLMDQLLTKIFPFGHVRD